MRDDNRSITICKRPATEIGPNVRVDISVDHDKERRRYELHITPADVTEGIRRIVIFDKRPGMTTGFATVQPNVARFNRAELERHAGIVRSNLDAAWPYILRGETQNALWVLRTGNVQETPEQTAQASAVLATA